MLAHTLPVAPNQAMSMTVLSGGNREFADLVLRFVNEWPDQAKAHLVAAQQAEHGIREPIVVALQGPGAGTQSS